MVGFGRLANKENITFFLTFKFFLGKIIFFSLLSLFFLHINQAQDESRIYVTFILSSSNLSSDSSVYITGSIDQLGNWNPGKIKMDYIGNNRWKKEISLNSKKSLEYKYTLGSWEIEGSDSNGLPLPNFNVNILTDTIINDEIFFWAKKMPKEIESTITGIINYHTGIEGEGILNRDIVVLLPPGYETESVNYPVIYMHDGQNIFNASTSSFEVEWRIDETIDSLIKFDFIPPVIVVGIYNTSERTLEYTPGEKGTAYMNFVVNKLKPFIDSTYRTKQDRENTIVGGSSAGGLISFMLLWEYPDIFSKAVCMSTAFKISFIDYVKFVDESTEGKRNIFIYIDNGGTGLELELQPGIDEMIDKLEEKGYIEGEDFYYSIFPEDEHNESSWAKRFPEAIKILLNK